MKEDPDPVLANSNWGSPRALRVSYIFLINLSPFTKTRRKGLGAKFKAVQSVYQRAY